MPWILVGVCFASGKHCHPYSEHFVSLYSCFRDSAAFEATPADTPASETILGLSGEDTEMSKSAVFCSNRIPAPYTTLQQMRLLPPARFFVLKTLAGRSLNTQRTI